MADKKLTVYFTSDLHGYIYPTDYRSRDERDIGLFKCASRFDDSRRIIPSVLQL